MMEVAVHHRMQAEEVVEQPQMWRRDDIAGGGDTTDSSSDENGCRHDINGMGSKTPINGMSSKKNVYSDKNEGNIKLPLSLSEKNPTAKDLNFPKLMNAVINNQNTSENISKDKILKASTSLITKETNVRIDHAVEESDHDIEEIELDFERSFEKVHTHTPYCPNCNSQITKVVLRRRIKKPEKIPPADEEKDLYGCLSCFRIFLPPGNDEGKPPVSSVPDSAETTPPDVVVDVSGTGTSGTDGDLGSNKSLEILKCIIYGGLMETIASLSVVSSAAASNATTFNILAIGFATVITSIFIFGHNLIDMKNESPRENSNQQVDRYQELIGKKDYFLLHATFGMLSFLIFDLIPPIVYGFAFRKSNNKNYKIIAVAAASFVCVFGLAIGKAYVGRKKKLREYVKTVLYYVTMAVCVSGVAYAAGDLIKLLMEKVGWFETTSTVSYNVPAWVSY